MGSQSVPRFAFACLILMCCTEIISSKLIVNTDSGKIQGTTSVSREGRRYNAFYKVPYAQPPIGELRFATPLSVENWSDVLNASEPGPMCPQIAPISGTFLGNEDCLHMNIFVPNVNDTGNLPILVYFHGGQFIVESYNEVGPKYFMDEDVIFISVSYRHGPLGFATTGDKFIRGNMGLKDCVKALEWIQINLKHFGGDASQITISGQSAGGVLVHYLMLSQKTKGLFARAISQSGVALGSVLGILPLEPAKDLTKDLAKRNNCPTTTSAVLLDCLHKVPIKQMYESTKETWTNAKALYIFNEPGEFLRPVLEAVDDEEAFMTEHPINIMKAGKQQNVPWLTGVNKDDGILTTYIMHLLPPVTFKMDMCFEACMEKLFLSHDPDMMRNEEKIQSLKELYFPDGFKTWENMDKQIKTYQELFTDAVFFAPLSEVAQILSNFSRLNLYRFEIEGAPNAMFTMLKKNDPLLPVRDYGVNHANELGLLFDLNDEQLIPTEHPLYSLSKDLIKMWMSFINGGPVKYQNVEAPAAMTPNSSLINYIVIDKTVKIVSEPPTPIWKFWHNFTEGFIQV